MRKPKQPRSLSLRPQPYGPLKLHARDIGMLPAGHYWCAECQRIVTSREEHGPGCPAVPAR
jgi:hypothetical protein